MLDWELWTGPEPSLFSGGRNKLFVVDKQITCLSPSGFRAKSNRLSRQLHKNSLQMSLIPKSTRATIEHIHPVS